MPLYEAKCEICGAVEEFYRPMAQCMETPEHCGTPMRRLFTAPHVADDIQPYISQIDGSVIHSRSQHRRHLRDHGCIEVGNETQTYQRAAPPPGLKQALIDSVRRHRR